LISRRQLKVYADILYKAMAEAAGDGEEEDDVNSHKEFMSLKYIQPITYLIERIEADK